MWMYLGLLCALFLGLHNLFKKHAVGGNEVFPVLLIAMVAGGLLLVPIYISSHVYPLVTQQAGLYIYPISWSDHGFIMLKSLLLSLMWLLSFEALKHLPITIVSPIESAGPFFTFIGAILLFHEQPSFWQWIGFFVIIASVFLYAKIGAKEGIIFRRNRWIFAILAATALSSVSGLYDKFLVQNLRIPPLTLQFWFSVYISTSLLIILAVSWFPVRSKRIAFQWRWSIPLVGILLQVSDFFYFRALEDPDAMIMLLTAIKRSQLLIAVLIGGLIYKEQNKRKKLIPLLGIIIGVCLILFFK